MNKILQGDCLSRLKELPDECVDAIVTDPPYGLEFMGKKWDKFTGSDTGIMAKPTSTLADKGFDSLPIFRGMDSQQINAFYKFTFEWAKECLRVLKPGGHLLAFGGSRTYHRLASGVEDAGFEIRDMIEWVYGSGFPKSHNIGKSVDKLLGNNREVIGVSEGKGYSSIQEKNIEQDNRPYVDGLPYLKADRTLTKGTSEWEGWGTALKPAHEPICMARKPLAEKTVAENCLKWGTGGINIDESRVGTSDKYSYPNGAGGCKSGEFHYKGRAETPAENNPLGRFPANLIHDNSEEVRECFPESKSSDAVRHNKKDNFKFFSEGEKQPAVTSFGFNDSGNASRFFKSILYYPKASKSERNKGCEGLEEKQYSHDGRDKEIENAFQRNKSVATNNHPTIKPIALMEYLIKMVTPKGGVVLDPFMGSGSTGVACIENGFSFIGIEMEAEYIKIAEARINAIDTSQTKLEVKSGCDANDDGIPPSNELLGILPTIL